MKTILILLIVATCSFGQDAPPSKTKPNVSWKRVLPDVVDDQKHIWSFPARLVKGKGRLPAAIIAGTTAGLGFLDAREARYFGNTGAFQGFNRVFSGNNTAAGTVIAPLGLYAAGLIRKDSGMQATALQAGEAVADVEILTTAMKDLDRRARPSDIGLSGNYWDSWFDSPGKAFGGAGSFPSGHTIAAFSIATVIARRYGKTRRFIPYAAYGLAGIVAFSRLSLSSHFTSDVFAGGALGYTIARFTVLRRGP